MTAPDDGYSEVLRRVVAGFGAAVVADSVEALPAAWARAVELGQRSVHVVLPAAPDGTRTAARVELAARGWVLLGLTRVMWPSDRAVSGPLTRQQRIDRDTRDVVAEVVPAGADAVGPLADALDRALDEVGTLLDLLGRPDADDQTAAPADGETGGRGVRRLLGRRQ